MDVRENLAAGKYENTVPHNVTKIPVDEERMTVKEAREHVDAEKTREREQRMLHRQNEGKMTALLKADLETEHGVSDHPKAGKVWSLAWEHGHSSGYSEVVSYYEEFVELIK